MSAIWLCMLLILHLTFTNLPPSAPVQAAPQPRQMWWGMIDPELSTWFARIPEEEGEDGLPVMWNWSWRGFWAALTCQPLVQEAADAPRL